jgi:hypothetical protein
MSKYFDSFYMHKKDGDSSFLYYDGAGPKGWRACLAWLDLPLVPLDDR